MMIKKNTTLKEIYNISKLTDMIIPFLSDYDLSELSREKLEEHVWDFDFSGSSNVIDVYIRYLRKKIDDGFETKLIKTIRGEGYTIKPWIYLSRPV